jgi:hypothetical protein
MDSLAAAPSIIKVIGIVVIINRQVDEIPAIQQNQSILIILSKVV